MQLMMSRAFAAQHSGSDEQDAMMCCMCCVHRLDRSIRFMISMSVRDRCREMRCRELPRSDDASEREWSRDNRHSYILIDIDRVIPFDFC
jgi:hypothetical protein